MFYDFDQSWDVNCIFANQSTTPCVSNTIIADTVDEGPIVGCT